MDFAQRRSEVLADDNADWIKVEAGKCPSESELINFVLFLILFDVFL